MLITQYTEKDKDVWNSFLNESKNPLFMFNRNYMEYHSDRFEDNSLLFYDENKELIALLPLSKNNTVLYSHGGLTFGGFITTNNMKQHRMLELFENLKTYMQTNSFTKIVYKVIPHIYHLQAAEEDIYALKNNNAIIEKIEAATVINLEDRLKMPKGRKAQISRAKREGVEIIESSNYKDFIALENAVLNKHHNATAVHTGEELEYLHSCFPENIKLFTGIYNGEIIAGAVIYIYKNVIHTQYLAANEKAREIGALDYVISTLLDLYKEKKWFDFGKSTEGDGSILNKGLISQKEGFGGRTFVYQTWSMSI